MSDHVGTSPEVGLYCPYCQRMPAHHVGCEVDMADRLAIRVEEIIRGAGDTGASRTDIRDGLGRHEKAARIIVALARLRDAGIIEAFQRKTGGRFAECWRLVQRS